MEPRCVGRPSSTALLLLLMSLISTAGCMLKPALQVDPCIVPPSAAGGGGRAHWLHVLWGERYTVPLREDALKTQYDTDVRTLGPVAARNEVIDQARLRCDQICASHKSDIVAQSVLQKLALGIAGIGLSAAGGLATGGASNILSASSTATQGTDKAISADVYKNQLETAIVTAIEAEQTRQLATIQQREGTSIEAYSLYAGLDDVERYHSVCSFTEGLRLVQNDVSAAKTKAQDDLTRSIVTPVEPSLQARREAAAAFVKTLGPAEANALATALGKSPGANAIPEVLASIGVAQSPAQFETITQQTKILFGRSF